MENMKLLSKAEVLRLVPYSPQHLLRLENQDRFPRRIKPGNGGRNAKAFWLEREVRDWIQRHLDNRE